MADGRDLRSSRAFATPFRGAADTVRDQFVVGLYLTVTLASVILAAAEGAWLPVPLTVPLAAAAYWVVERRRSFALPTWAANGLGLLALAAGLAEWAVRDVEGRILFGAHLLAYLSWIFLWQEKAPRQRWGLLALAVLQVAVGAVLTNSPLFGFGAVAFLAATAWTLALLQLAEAEAGRDARSAAVSAVAIPRGPRDPCELLRAGTAVVPAGSSGPAAADARKLLPAVAVTVAGAVAVGAAFFLVIPRYEIGRRAFDDYDAPLSARRVTGFTQQIKLGGFGQVLESSSPVFQVRVTDGVGGDPLPVDTYASSLGFEEPLFRGLTLGRYAAGEWNSESLRYPDELTGIEVEGAVRQEYRLQPLSSPVVFAIAPVQGGVAAGGDMPLRIRRHDETLLRPASGASDRKAFGYTVFAARTAGEAERLRRATGSGRLPSWAADRYVELPDGLEILRRTAAEVARPGGVDATPAERADRLTAYLRDSGRFGYSLSGAVVDPRLDPVEDFLENRRSGHCEYFASALALMLRAEGVPARVVNGFKGGETNRLTGWYEVQQRHAHSWVEAHLDGRWVTLDPTPAGPRDESVREHASRAEFVRQLGTAVGNAWRDYVVQMDINRQRRAVAPLKATMTDLYRAAVTDWLPAFRRRAWAFATDPGRWFSWEGAVVSFVVLTAAVGLHRLARRLSRRRTRADRGGGRARHGRRVDFYERFRRLCARRGWSAERSDTPREFAAAVERRLSAGRPLPPALADLPRELTEEFYRSRFGELAVPEARARELDARLTELEAAITDGRTTSTPAITGA